LGGASVRDWHLGGASGRDSRRDSYLGGAGGRESRRSRGRRRSRATGSMRRGTEGRHGPGQFYGDRRGADGGR
jgi:hypothetical protein